MAEYRETLLSLDDALDELGGKLDPLYPLGEDCPNRNFQVSFKYEDINHQGIFGSLVYSISRDSVKYIDFVRNYASFVRDVRKVFPAVIGDLKLKGYFSLMHWGDVGGSLRVGVFNPAKKTFSSSYPDSEQERFSDSYSFVLPIDPRSFKQFGELDKWLGRSYDVQKSEPNWGGDTYFEGFRRNEDEKGAGTHQYPYSQIVKNLGFPPEIFFALKFRDHPRNILEMFEKESEYFVQFDPSFEEDDCFRAMASVREGKNRHDLERRVYTLGKYFYFVYTPSLIASLKSGKSFGREEGPFFIRYEDGEGPTAVYEKRVEYK